MISFLKPTYILAIITCILSMIITNVTYANYKRCWLNSGVPSINCNPADGYFYVQQDNLYKKCNVTSGNIEKNCKIEDGYALILDHHRWYQCPIQNGKKLNHCSLATGYYTIFLSHLPRI